MNTIKIKHGSGDPSGKLQPYELGFRDDTGALYINNGISTVQLTGLAATGLVNANSCLQLPQLLPADSRQNKILVADANNIIYSRTPAEICSDIGALSLANGGTIAKDLTITGKLTANGTIIVDTDSYGSTNPNDAGIMGTTGQLYFVVTG